MSVTSSTMPSMVENSWATPFTLTPVTAVPSIDEYSTRRSELPIVLANPRSNGSAKNIAYVGVAVFSSTETRVGSSKSFQRTRMTVTPCIPGIRTGRLASADTKVRTRPTVQTRV